MSERRPPILNITTPLFIISTSGRSTGERVPTLASTPFPSPINDTSKIAKMGFLRKYIFPILFGVIFFSLFKNHLPKFKVLSALETIDLLKKNDKLSLVRFGDGEFDIIAQKRGPNYQRTSPRLREALLKILNSRSICVAVPEALSVDVLTPENSTNSHLRFWRTYVVLRAQLFRHILDSTRLYGDACVSRPYTNSQDDQLATQVFRQIRTLWANKNVVVIEGELTRFGVGNDLLNDAASVKRIIGPAKNAFEKCDQLLEEARKQPEDTIFIVALGPAAKIIAYELSNQFKTLDLGHLDIEYEWYLRKMKEGGSVPNKYVNEARVNFDSESEPFDPSLYESQIIAKFLN